MTFETGLGGIHPPVLYKIMGLMGIGFILISLSIILITPSAANFEFSIYNAFPFFFWLALFAAMVIGSGILVINGLSNKPDKSHWFFGILIIILADSILLFMPLIRGYLNYGSGDVLTHIGMMKDIMRVGYVSSSNMYPIDHILGVTLHFFSGLSFQNITMLIPGLFSLFFIISCYILSKEIFSKQSERLLLLAIASILLFSNYQMVFAPNAQALMLFPFFLYLLFKSNISGKNWFFSILFVVMCILIVFFHPLITLIIVLFLVLYKMALWMQKKINITGNYDKNINTLIFLVSILFLSWTSYLIAIVKITNPIIDTISGSGESVSQYQGFSNIISQVNIDIPYLIRLIVSTYGQEIILGGLSLICSLYLLIKITRREKISFIHLISTISFLTLFVVSILMFFINGSFGFERIYYCVLIFSIILIPSIGLMMGSDLKAHTILTAIIVLLILSGTIWCSLFNIYLSPITKKMNQQVTKSEYSGMITFYQFRDESFQILENGVSHYRMYEVLYGRDYPKVNVRYIRDISLLLPDHFNYTSGSSLGRGFNDYNYFLLTRQGKFFYQNMYPEFQEKWRFTPADFQQLNYDTSVQQIYNNGNLEIGLIGNRRVL